MSSNNNGAAGAGLALIMTGAILASFFLMAIFSVIAMLLTVFCIIAWNKPFTIGDMTITPEEARGCVGSGVGGAVLLPVCVAFAYYGLHIRIAGDLLPITIFGGYVVGSLSFAGYCAYRYEEDGDDSDVEENGNAPQIPARPTASPATPPAKDFEYASWDDDKEAR